MSNNGPRRRVVVASVAQSIRYTGDDKSYTDIPKKHGDSAWGSPRHQTSLPPIRTTSYLPESPGPSPSPGPPGEGKKFSSPGTAGDDGGGDDPFAAQEIAPTFEESAVNPDPVEREFIGQMKSEPYREEIRRQIGMKGVMSDAELDELCKNGNMTKEAFNNNQHSHWCLGQENVDRLLVKLSNIYRHEHDGAEPGGVVSTGPITRMEALSLEKSELTTLSDAVYDLKDLEMFSLGRNQLRDLPTFRTDRLAKGLRDLQKLELFFADNNRFTTIPPDTFALKNLRMLSFCNNWIRSIPSTIGNLTHLRTLYLSDNRLTSIPPEIGKLSSLIELYIHNNQLTSIPRSLGELVKLQTLDASGNRLNTLPDELWMLRELGEIYLQNNSIHSISYDAVRAIKLRRLDIHHNLPLNDKFLRISAILEDFGVKVKLPQHLQDNWSGEALDNTGLHWCAEEEEFNEPAQEKILQRILHHAKNPGELVNRRNAKGQTALHIACRRNNAFLATQLIKYEADPTILDMKGYAAVEYIGYDAIRTFSHDHPFFGTKIAELFKDCDDIMDEYRLLIDCCLHPKSYGRYGVLNEVAEKYRDFKQKGVALFMSMMKEAREETRKRRADFGPGEHELNARRYQMFKLWRNQLTLTSNVVQPNPNWDQGNLAAEGDKAKFQPLVLQMLAMKGDDEKLSVLLRSDAPHDTRNSLDWQSSLLHTAARYGHANIVETFGSDFPLLSQPEEATSSTKKRFSFRKLRTVDTIDMELRSRINQEDAKGRFPLHFAIEGGHIDCVETLVKYGADMGKAARKTKKEHEVEPDSQFISAHKLALHVLNSQQSELKRVVENGATETNPRRIALEDNVNLAKRQIEVIRTRKEVAKERRWFAFKYFFTESYYYTIVIVLLTYISFSLRDTNRLPLKHALEERILGTEFPFEESHTFKAFNEISDGGEFWAFVENPLAEGLFPDEDYSGAPLSEYDSRFLDGAYSRLIGAVRFRQLRVAPVPCAQEDHTTAWTECYPEYSTAHESREPFGPNGEWKWMSAHDAGGMETRFGGTFRSYYGASGFVVDVPANDAAQFKTTITSMKENGFIDKQTRVIFIETYHLNANTNLVAALVMMVEIPQTGALWPTSDLRLLGLDLNSSTSQILQIVLMFLVLKFFWEDISELVGDGIGKFIGFWNVIDVVTNGVFVASFALHMSVVSEMSKVTLDSDSTVFVNLQWPIFLQEWEIDMYAVNMFLCYFRLLKYGELLPGVGPVVLAVTRTMYHTDIVIFLVFFVITLVALVLGHHLAFGSDMEDFMTMPISTLTMLKTTFGEYGDIINIDQPLTIVFFALSLVLVVLVLLNLFIAVISKVYEDLQQKSLESWNDEMTEFMSEELERKYRPLEFGEQKEDREKSVQDIHNKYMNCVFLKFTPLFAEKTRQRYRQNLKKEAMTVADLSGRVAKVERKLDECVEDLTNLLRQNQR